jgi:GNAT superfamily N-acetyltransferase
VHVATASGLDLGASGGPSRIIGFVTGSASSSAKRLAEGEIETLYVLDDWRDRGIGRRLMRACASHLAAIGCGSVFVWVLRENPSRWFYERLGGTAAAASTIQVGGQAVDQTAYVWSPIDRLVQATSTAP